tara:strand:- start:57 stop:437 length:381 start_codon:yes stop_codon:yes gene_type:complete
MKIKYLLLTLLTLIIVGCSEPDPLKESYVQDCSADGAAPELCSCLFDYAKMNMSDIELMSSDFTSDYRQENNIPMPGEAGEDEYLEILVDPDCFGMCEMKPNPDYQEPASQENIASIVMDAFSACN